MMTRAAIIDRRFVEKRFGAASAGAPGRLSVSARLVAGLAIRRPIAMPGA
jgi:hypothetical protein